MSQFGKLICISGPNTGKEYLLTEEISTIGRSEECTITIDEQLVSRNHAEIHRIDNAYQVHDLQSKNGIYVNNKRLALSSNRLVGRWRRNYICFHPFSVPRSICHNDGPFDHCDSRAGLTSGRGDAPGLCRRTATESASECETIRSTLVLVSKSQSGCQ